MGEFVGYSMEEEINGQVEIAKKSLDLKRLF